MDRSELNPEGLQAARRMRGNPSAPRSVQTQLPTIDDIILAYFNAPGVEVPQAPESPLDPVAPPDSPRAPQEPADSPLQPPAPSEPPGGPGADVTTVVRATGETETQFCAEDGYIVVTGPERYVSHENVHANGTAMITIKKRPEKVPA